MKKFLMIMTIGLFFITSCEKEELTAEEYMRCEVQLKTDIQSAINSYNAGFIDYNEYNNRLNEADYNYNQCIIRSSKNK